MFRDLTNRVTDEEYVDPAKEAHGRSIDVQHQAIGDGVPYIAPLLQKTELFGERYLAGNVEGGVCRVLVNVDSLFEFGRPVKPGQELVDNVVNGILGLQKVAHRIPGCQVSGSFRLLLWIGCRHWRLVAVIRD